MKQVLAVMALLVLAACSTAIDVPADQDAVVDAAPDVTNNELVGVDDVDAILNDLDNLDADLNLDAELAALDANLQ